MRLVTSKLTVCVLVLLGVAATARGAPQAAAGDTAAYESPSESVKALIQQAGNADRDADRLRYLRELAALDSLGPRLRQDLEVLLSEVEQYV